MDSGLLPTTKHRRGRRTARQEAALASGSPFLVDPGAIASLVGLGRRVVLDIGFGTGEAVTAYAASDPDTVILAVDMHTPGIGDLLASIAERDLTNIYVVDGDVRVVLADVMTTGSLAGARTFFPDPWPKKRHHRRRLIQPAFADLLADRVCIGGFWHIATDWLDYADHIDHVVHSIPTWQGGIVRRPEHRPQTRYERRGLAAGRRPIDLWFDRVAP